MPKVIRKDVDQSRGHCFKPRAATEGSPDVYVNDAKVVRVGDFYPVHRCDDDSHSGVASEGSPDVFINNLAIHRNGDAISCGDTANNGSPNVFINEG